MEPTKQLVLNYSSHLNITFRGDDEFDTGIPISEWDAMEEEARNKLVDDFVNEWMWEHIEVWLQDEEGNPV